MPPERRRVHSDPLDDTPLFFSMTLRSLTQHKLWSPCSGPSTSAVTGLVPSPCEHQEQSAASSSGLTPTAQPELMGKCAF